jgi:hypothetical protein
VSVGSIPTGGTMPKTWEDVVNSPITDKDGNELDVHHEITWWISEPLTLQQWSDLDNAQFEAFESVGINPDNVSGVAGPIPFDR